MAKGKASALTHCSGFAQVLSGLEGRALTSEKPQARKVSAAAKRAKAKGLRASKGKGKGKGKKLVNVKAGPGITVLPHTSSASSIRKKPANPVGTKHANPGGNKSAKPLSMSRNCVHSRAYCKAKAEAKAQGLGLEEQSKLACAAGKVATVQWDNEFMAERDNEFMARQPS